MVLNELALVGVGRFRHAIRIRFRSGLNLIRGGIGAGKTTIYRTLLSLFCAGPAPAGSSPPSQAGILFTPNNTLFLRLTQDFVQGTMTLAEMDGSLKTFRTIAKEPADILARIRERAGAGDRPIRIVGTLENSGGVEPEASNLVVPKAGNPNERIAPPVGVDHASAAGRKGPTSERLRSLRLALERAERLNDLEALQADKKGAIASIRKRLAQAEELKREAQRLTERGNRSGLGEVPENLGQILADYQEQLRQHDEELLQHQQEIEAVMLELGTHPAPPIFRQPLFLTGISLVVLSLVTAVVLPLPAFFRHVYLVALGAGLLFTLLAVIGDLRRTTRRRATEQRVAAKEKTINLLQAKFSREQAAVLRWIKAAGVETAKELLDRWEEGKRIQRRVEELAEECGRILEGKEAESWRTELEALERDSARLREEIAAMAGADADPIALQTAIRELEQSSSGVEPKASNIVEPKASNPVAPKASNRADAESADPAPTPVPPAPAAAHPVTTELCAQASPLLARLSAGRYERIVVRDGRPAVTQGEEEIGLDRLSPGERLQVELALLLGDPDLAGPILLDEPLSPLDPPGRQRLLELLAERARTAQILLFTHEEIPAGGPAASPPALHQIEIP